MAYVLFYLLLLVWLILPGDEASNSNYELRIDLAEAREDIDEALGAAHNLMALSVNRYRKD